MLEPFPAAVAAYGRGYSQGKAEERVWEGYFGSGGLRWVR